MQFFILMIDYGKGPQRPMGFGSDVQGEFSRADIVVQARDIISRGRYQIAFVKFIDGNYCEDITAEILAEAGFTDAPLSPINRQAARFDHARDILKHEVA